MHGALRLYNELPRGKLAQDLLKNADEGTRRNYSVGEFVQWLFPPKNGCLARKNSKRLLMTLIEAEEAMLSGSPQTKNILINDATKDFGMFQCLL